MLVGWVLVWVAFIVIFGCIVPALFGSAGVEESFWEKYKNIFLIFSFLLMAGMFMDFLLRILI